jgi:hypothetical protein
VLRERLAQLLEQRGRTSTRCALVASAGSFARSGRSITRHSVWNCLSLTAPMNSCSSSAMVNTSYTLQADTREGIGGAAFAGHLELLHVLGGQQRAVLEQRALDLLAAAGAVAFLQRGQHADGAEHAAHDVVDEEPARSGRPLGPVM